ncbi:MAG: DUF721 domain-containing protein [Deltaproteobacteria bacterium]|nr:DUF721 domain-containing protein [Deltaproteobacteria bacterium]
MPTRPPSDLIPLDRILADSMDSGFLGLAKDMVKVFEVWVTAVGEYNATKAWPESIHNGCLTVLVESPAWIDHFGYFKQAFIDGLNQALRGPLVTDIKFKVGSRPERKHETPAKKMTSEKTAELRAGPLPAAQAAVEQVKDLELRKTLAKLLAAQRR